MAKLSTSTYLDLTQVTDLGATARFDFDNRRGNLPAAGEQVTIDGFANAGNNVDAFLTSITATQPGYFIVGKTTETNETHDALATVKHTGGCSPIPKPPKTSAVQKGSTLTNCVFHGRTNKPKRGAKSVTVNWTGIMKMSVFDISRFYIRRLAFHWRKVLSAGQRNTWKAAAAGATIYGYGGSVHTPTGFEFFIQAAKWQSTLYWDPYDVGTFGPPFIVPIPPWRAWQNMASPVPTYAEVFDNYKLYVEFSSVPLTDDHIIMAQISRKPTSHTRSGPWFMSAGSDGGDFGFPIKHAWRTRLDYPFHRPEVIGACSLAFHWYDGASYGTSPYSYLNVT